MAASSKSQGAPGLEAAADSCVEATREFVRSTVEGVAGKVKAAVDGVEQLQETLGTIEADLETLLSGLKDLGDRDYVDRIARLHQRVERLIDTAIIAHNRLNNAAMALGLPTTGRKGREAEPGRAASAVPDLGEDIPAGSSQAACKPTG